MSYRSAHGAGWSRAKDCLAKALGISLRSDEIGWIRHLGRGLCRDAYIAEVARTDYVVLLLRHDAEPGCTQRIEPEARLLRQLQDMDLSLRIPEVVAVVEENQGPALVETAVSGIPLDFLAGRQSPIQSWNVVARVAAAVHQVDTCRLGGFPGFATRRAHGEDSLQVFEDLRRVDEPVVRDARAWALEHLPAAAPARLLHGDLLGQNILLSLADGEPPGLIDWENALLGDPAYDLSIVTRGLRRPFKLADGTARLLEAYAEHSDVEITEADVRFHEICLGAEWLRSSLDPHSQYPHPPEQEIQRLRGMLRRALKA